MFPVQIPYEVLGVDEDAVRSSGKFLRRYAVGFRKVFVQIPGDVPEISRDATGLNFVVGFTFTQFTGHLISRCMAWCSLVNSCSTYLHILTRAAACVNVRAAWLPFLCRNSCSQRSSVQNWRVSHAFLVVIHWVTIFPYGFKRRWEGHGGVIGGVVAGGVALQRFFHRLKFPKPWRFAGSAWNKANVRIHRRCHLRFYWCENIERMHQENPPKFLATIAYGSNKHSDIVIEPSFVFEQGGTMGLLTVFHM